MDGAADFFAAFGCAFCVLPLILPLIMPDYVLLDDTGYHEGVEIPRLEGIR